MALSTALRLLTGVVVFIVMARMWGPERFGTFMYWFTATSLSALIVDYGFGQQLMREIGLDKTQTRRLLSGIFSAKCLLTAGMVLLFGVASISPWGQAQPLLLFWVLLLACIFSSFADTFNAAFRGLGQYHEETVIAAWVNFLHFGLVLALLALNYGVVEVATGFLISRVLFLLLAFRTYNRLVPVDDLNDEHPIVMGVRNLKVGFPFAAEAVFTNFQSQADTLIVHHFLGAGAVGIYQAGLRLMQGANTFAQVLSNVYLPSMASKVGDKSGLKLLANRLFWQMLLLGTISMLVFGFGAKTITHALYGTRYEELIQLMPWFGVLLLLRYIAASHGVTLSAVGLQSTRVVAVFTALVTLFVATYLLVPQFELLGMLFASIAAVGCLYFVYALTLALRGYPLGINKLNAAALVAVAGMTFFLITGN